jgi:hypothetical protein
LSRVSGGDMNRRAFLCGTLLPLVVASPLLLGGCATRPINPPLLHYDVSTKYRFEGLERNRGDRQDLVILAFSGGGTRAAAFSYGVLEALRRIEVVTNSGRTIPSPRWGRRHHRHIGRQLHGARVRAVWRKAVR